MPAGKFPRAQVEAQRTRLLAHLDAQNEAEAQAKCDVGTLAKFLIQTLNDTTWPDHNVQDVVDAWRAFQRLHPNELIRERTRMAARDAL